MYSSITSFVSSDQPLLRNSTIRYQRFTLLKYNMSLSLRNINRLNQYNLMAPLLKALLDSGLRPEISNTYVKRLLSDLERNDYMESDTDDYDDPDDELDHALATTHTENGPYNQQSST
ncbi:unnamed protein product [Adineta ricciae]|uniref:Uncharacterized protein n=1 Tax=Adineta ricciae TaxID=249248 RepID=A0A815A299_ADIRI|nr:unnamed protein product [Adineta ricciae]CAF1551401.1 unnamed protein product [Adineta ricciae]